MNHARSSFIWSVADLLRGDYKQSEYGRVILAVRASLGYCWPPRFARYICSSLRRKSSGSDSPGLATACPTLMETFNPSATLPQSKSATA